METRYAKVLVAVGDQAFYCWQPLESQVEDPAKNLDAFWDAFESSLKQTTTNWHFIDHMLSDFR